MISIGCNWSEHLFKLLEGNKVTIDYIKTGAFGAFDTRFEAMLSLRPVLLHGLGHYERAGMLDTGIIDFERANSLLAKCKSPHYGLHLCIMNKDMPQQLTEAQIAARVDSRIKLFKENINLPILIENIPETPQEHVLYDHYPYADPDKISRAVLDNDVGLLLDITHAKITCIYKKWNVYDYLKALPLDKIREIHTNGSGLDKNGDPDDTHHPMTEEDYALLEFVLEHSSPAVVSLEYVGVEGETDEQISENLKFQLSRINNLAKGAVL